MIRGLLLGCVFAAASITTASATPPGPVGPLAPKAMSGFQTHYLGGDMSMERYEAFIHLFEGDAVIQAIESVAAHGLYPEDYHLETLKEYGTVGDDMALYALDGWMSAASHLAFGKLSPTSVEPDWTAKRWEKGREADLYAHLTEALETGTLAGSLDRLAPQHAAYQSLRSEMARLLDKSGKDTAVIEPGETLRPGMASPRLRAVQARLGIAQTGVYDDATQAAVLAFQSGAGLDADGLIGPATVRALNRSDQTAMDMLRVNMERWRWLPDDLGRRHVRVNIADFSVQAWRDGRVDRVHAAIVGKPFRKTPVFSDRIRYVVLNPWWETPASLARLDKLPLFQRDPAAVQRLGFQVLDRQGQAVDASTIDWKSIPAGTMPYRIRQAPGELNALGEVKIMFPNSHNVYLHDTPSRGLFAQRQRAFSSGCIRTQDPIDLTEWLLDETPGWDRARIDSALAGKRETRADLAESVPVHILYMTAVSDAAGVRYVDDIYDRDAAVLAGLKRGMRVRP